MAALFPLKACSNPSPVRVAVPQMVGGQGACDPAGACAPGAREHIRRVSFLDLPESGDALGDSVAIGQDSGDRGLSACRRGIDPVGIHELENRGMADELRTRTRTSK